jgi:hypothetical protein
MPSRERNLEHSSDEKYTNGEQIDAKHPPCALFSKGPSIAGYGLAVIWGCWCPPCGSHKRSVNRALAISSTATKDFASLVMGGLSFAGAWAHHTITQRWKSSGPLQPKHAA